MAESDQATAPPAVSAQRHRWTWITVLTIAVVSGSALVAVPAIADDAATPPAHDRVVVCESGVVDQGEIQTSSAVAVRVGDDAPVPKGCRDG